MHPNRLDLHIHGNSYRNANSYPTGEKSLRSFHVWQTYHAQNLLVASYRLMKFCCSEVEHTVFLESVLLEAQILVNLSHDLGPKRSSLIEEAGVASPYYLKSKWLLSPSWGRQVKCLGLFYFPSPLPPRPSIHTCCLSTSKDRQGTVCYLSLQIREIEHRP